MQGGQGPEVTLQEQPGLASDRSLGLQLWFLFYPLSLAESLS